MIDNAPAVTSVRQLYVVRHGEAAADGSGLTEVGRRQAEMVGRRLAGREFGVVWHGPLPRAAETAAVIARELPGVPLVAEEAAGDYPPYVPRPGEAPEVEELAARALAQYTEAERTNGPRLAREAVARFTGPVPGPEPRSELLVTHSFLIGHLLGQALGAPAWRWIGLNQGNAALTVIRYTPGRPASVLVHNDTAHLPEELRWTGFPPQLRV